MEAWMMIKEETEERLNSMIWSFSRVNSASKCLYAWYLQYVIGYTGQPNAYAQFGTTCHETIEKFLKGELNMFNASEYYQKRYAELVTCDFPPNKYVDLGEKTFNQGLQYFNNINFDFDRYEVLGVEKELLFNVGKYPFRGYADAIYRDRANNNIILCDQKTSSFKYLKDGSVSKINEEHYREFRRQLYLYSIPLIEKYGKVDYLKWNMIRDQRKIIIKWDEKEYKETIDWCIKSIESLKNEILWLPDTSNDFWCNHICSMSKTCIYHNT